jgi:hypothetical protein
MRSAALLISLALACTAAPPTREPAAIAVEPAPNEPLEPIPSPLVPISDADVDTIAPPGFTAADEFADIASACAGLVPRLVARDDLRGPILDWCLVRAYESSRNGRVRSRIDGSWIHDRDRPAARAFYSIGVRAGDLEPDSCEHHRVDTSIKRSRAAAGIVYRWPHATHCDPSTTCRPTSPGKMVARVASRWLSTPPDYERFGTRGPMDVHAAIAARYLGGCFPPEQIDRFDVAAAVVIERAEDLCERLEQRLDTRRAREDAKRAGLPVACKSSRDIRAIWRPSFWSREIRALGR